MRLDRTGLIAGVVFVVLGVLFLLEQLGVLDVRTRLVLPIVLIAFGVGLLVGRDDDRASLATEQSSRDDVSPGERPSE